MRQHDRIQPIARALLTARAPTWPKPVQSYGRLFSPPGKPLSSRRTANLPRWKGLPALSSACRGCLAQGQDTEALMEGRFSFLHREISFPGEIDWSPPGTGRLWRHHLQYLDWALALALEGNPGCLTVLNERLDEWLMHNPQGWSDGWEPDPLSVRIVNLAYMLSLPGAISSRRAGMLHAALAVQARALTKGIDTALQGNQLIKNGKALLVAGLAFAGEEAEDWFRRGLALLEREMEIQVHPDGGHADRSAMYQIRVFLDYLESLSLLESTGRHIPAVWIKRLNSMAVCLEALYHPDGLPALLGDTSLAGLPPKRQVLAMARELGLRPKLLGGCATREFPDVAYVMGRDLRRGNYLIVDSGAHGDAIEAAHHHFQAFSYELSLEGRRLVTDTGIGSYEAGLDRARGRSTAAHNTISWCGREQAEFWDAFRIGRRAQILDRRVHETANGALRFEGRMKGFYPGPDRGCWRRRLWWTPAGKLEVTDTWLSPRPAQGVVSNVHFAPGLNLADERTGKWGIHITNGPRIATLHILEGEGALRKSPYYPSFGETHERDCLEIALEADTARYQISSGP
jgi:hypothetical protein